MPRTATVKKLRPQPEFPLDSHPETSLDFTRVKQYLAKHPYRKPVLLVDLDIVRSKTKRFRAALPRVRRHPHLDGPRRLPDCREYVADRFRRQPQTRLSCGHKGVSLSFNQN